MMAKWRKKSVITMDRNQAGPHATGSDNLANLLSHLLLLHVLDVLYVPYIASCAYTPTLDEDRLNMALGVSTDVTLDCLFGIIDLR